MFGMDKRKNNKDDWTFDLEKDLKEFNQKKALLQKVDDQVFALKSNLRSGEGKKDFDSMQTLLHGYLAMKKVMERVNRKL